MLWPQCACPRGAPFQPPASHRTLPAQLPLAHSRSDWATSCFEGLRSVAALLRACAPRRPCPAPHQSHRLPTPSIVSVPSAPRYHRCALACTSRLPYGVVSSAKVRTVSTLPVYQGSLDGGGMCRRPQTSLLVLYVQVSVSHEADVWLWTHHLTLSAGISSYETWGEECGLTGWWACHVCYVRILRSHVCVFILFLQFCKVETTDKVPFPVPGVDLRWHCEIHFKFSDING